MPTNEEYDEELGVQQEYADELSDRVDVPGENGPVAKVAEHFSGNTFDWTATRKAPATSAIVFLVNTVREVGRRAENHSVEKMATSILLDSIEDAAETGQLYTALENDPPEELSDGLVEYVLSEARDTIGMLQEEE